MFWISRAELLAHFWIGAIPEAAQIARDLHRTSVRREQRQDDGLAARTDTRRFREAEELLQLHRRRNGPVGVVLESVPPAARNREHFRCVTLDDAQDIRRQRVRECDT